MKKIALLLLATLERPGYGAEPPAVPSPFVLAEAMRQASYSDGFEARMNVVKAKPDGWRSAPIRLAVIGQFGAGRQRLLIRGISPESVRGRFYAAERSADGRIRSVEYGSHVLGGIAQADPFARLFDTGLVLWDLFAPWWDWPKQKLAGTAQIAGRDCAILRSQSGSADSPVREVVSCVVKDAGLSLRTQLLDRQRKPVRSIEVKQMMGRESGMMAAKEVSITEADHSVTEAAVYGGDEHYAINPATFAALDARRADFR